MTVARIDETHDPARTSWVAGADDHPDFPIQNLPLGIFSPPGSTPRPGVAIGDRILDLRASAGLLPEAVAEVLDQPVLNALLARPSSDRVGLRRRLSALLSDVRYEPALAPYLHEATGCRLHLPAEIGDYTDFYVGIHHATNIGKLLRPDTPLLPNYKWVPIGYHGRASSVRVSGEPVLRPTGQRREAGADAPIFAPSERLDFELELGVWVGQGNAPGVPVVIDAAAGHVAGLCLLNDWSARDFQAWEYQPLGPFLSKNFDTSISPWIVTSEALAPFRVAQAARPSDDPRPLPYLWDDQDQENGAFAIVIEVAMTTARMRDEERPAFQLSVGDARAMYWTVAQLIAHHTSNGCNLRPGDLLGTGTISTADRSGLGSLMEITQGGAVPIELPTGEARTFLADGDEITFTGRARAAGFRSIGFGLCSAIVGSTPASR